MALMDEFREERASVKQKPLKDKIAYIMDYYKWPIIGAVIAIIIISSLIYGKLTEKEDALNGLLLNVNLYGSASALKDCDTLSDDFLNTLNLNNQKYKVSFNPSITYYVNGDNPSQYFSPQNQQLIMTLVSTGTADFMTADTDTMLVFAYQGYFMDLSEILSDEEYAAYEPYFLYIDATFSDRLNELKENGSSDTSIEVPDWTDPDSMEKPVPVLIDMSKSDKLMQIYNQTKKDTICMGFPYTLPHKDTAVEFLKYVMPEQP
jgi:hypothetical protein